MAKTYIKANQIDTVDLAQDANLQAEFATVGESFTSEYWSLVNGSYDSVLEDVSTNTTNPGGIFFKSDGTEMYLANGVADQIDQYTLGSAWDINSATYTGTGSTSSELYVYDLWFRPDGKKVYTVGSSGFIRQWSLGTAWDITTISYDSIALQVSTQDAGTRGVYMRSDGLRFYVASSTGDEVNEYRMATAWDLSTADFNGKVVDLTTEDGVLVNVFFTSNGDRMFALGETNNALFQYTLTTSWDITTATYDSVTLSVNAEETSPSGFFIKPDGTKLYLVGGDSNVYQYSIPGSDVITRATETQFGTLQVPTNLEMTQGSLDNAAVTPKKLKTWAEKNIPLDQFTSVGWDLLNAEYLSENSTYIGTQTNNPGGMYFKPDGTELYIAEWDADKIDQYTLGIPWDVTSMVYTGTMDTTSTGLNVYDVWLSSDGTKAFICSSSNISYQYNLSTAWDISSGTYSGTSYSHGHTNTYCFFFRADGTKLYTVDTGTDQIVQHSLATAWDLNTASADSKIYDTSAEDTFPRDVFFKDDGSEMFVLGSTNVQVYKYTLSSAWDVSTAEYDFAYDITTSGLTTPFGLFFSTGGGLMFVTDAASAHMIHGFDVSSSNILASASDSVEGIVELATQAEVNAGTDTTRVVTPATLDEKLNDTAMLLSIINGA
jgi:hypothetical protein